MSAGRASTLRWASLGVGLIALLLVVRNVTDTAPLDRLASVAEPGIRPVMDANTSAANASSAGPASATAVHRSGSIWLPRGGPYVLGFDSPSETATLTIGARPIAGKGLVSQRLVFDAGVHAIEYMGPANVRLLWHPPGRRGPLEYLPASSLSSLPPAMAKFGSGAGRSVRDGGFAIAIVLVVVGCVVGRSRRRLLAAWRNHRGVIVASAVLFAVALLVRLFDLGGAGQTWDEDVNWSAGRNYITNLLSLDFSPAAWQWNYEHPPVMKYLVGVGAQLSDGYGPARAISALVGAMAVALVVPIGTRLYSLRVGVIAAIIVAFTPHLVAHSKVVGHESPSLLWWTLAVWLSLRVWDHAPSRRQLIRRLALVGAVLGVAIASRFVNVLLAPLLGCILMIEAPVGRRKEMLWLGAAVLPAVAVLVFYLLWPRLWLHPFAALSASWAKLKNPHSAEPYLGVITNLPARHYFAVYLIATAPVGVLIGVGLGLVRTVAQPSSRRAAAVLALFLAAPLLVLASPVRQDGVRYIMPSLAALALLAGAGYGWLAERIPRVPGKSAFLAIAATVTVYMLITVARIHPYYLDYYGEHVGGTERVAKDRLFEVAWWGEGLGEAIAYVNAHAEPGARIHRGCVEPGHLTWFRGDLWSREAQRTEDADWVVHYQPSWRSCPIDAGLVLVHTVVAGRAPLVKVYARGAPGGAAKDTADGSRP